MHWTQKYLAELGHIRRRMRALQGSLPPPLHSNLKTPSQQGNAEQWAQSCLCTALSSLCLEATWSWQSWADAESKSTTHLAVQDWQLRGGVLYGPWPHWINTSQSPPPPQKSQPWDCPIITLVPITKKKKDNHSRNSLWDAAESHLQVNQPSCSDIILYYYGIRVIASSM